ncbi:hypothetical protein [Hasllibacter sp. MH4015]|uniref:hypothetical protein n=1 Tax=Hasllibacter sp. MH4015 TaxID=2854029 RepID=UPI001CD557B0|nr:hypothetical protein [Hasllibacter sp. MH4015]
MPLLMNLFLVVLLIGCAGLGGYLLARAHFTATIANRVLAYQSRLARAQRDGKQAHKDVARLTEELAVAHDDLARSRDRVNRYETALFEGYPASEVDLSAAAQGLADQPLQDQANAYLQRVGAVDDFGAVIEPDLGTTPRPTLRAEPDTRSIA